MPIEENKIMVRRYFEISNEIKGDPSKVQALAEEFLAPEFVAHHSMLGDMSVEQYVATYEKFCAAFPDLNYSITNIIAEEDKVVVQCMATGTHKGEFQGVPPTGKKINVMAFGLYRIANGKFVENWGLVDNLAHMQQLGLIPSQQ